MSTENPLEDSDLAELLAAERAAPEPPRGTRDRVWQRLGVAVALPLPPGDGGLAVAAAGKAGLAVKLGVGAGLVAGGGGLVVALRPAEAPVPVVAPALAEAPPPSAALALDAPPTGAPAPDHPPAEDPVGIEAGLLRQAIAALERGDLPAADAALAAYARRFPAGVLAPEHASLTIHTHVRAGRPTAARAALQAFQRRFPDSPVRSNLEALVRTAEKE